MHTTACVQDFDAPLGAYDSLERQRVILAKQRQARTVTARFLDEVENLVVKGWTFGQRVEDDTTDAPEFVTAEEVESLRDEHELIAAMEEVGAVPGDLARLSILGAGAEVHVLVAERVADPDKIEVRRHENQGTFTRRALELGHHCFHEVGETVVEMCLHAGDVDALKDLLDLRHHQRQGTGVGRSNFDPPVGVVAVAMEEGGQIGVDVRAEDERLAKEFGVAAQTPLADPREVRVSHLVGLDVE